MAVSTMQEDKKKALSLAIAQIEKSCGKGSIMRLGAEQRVRIDCIPTAAEDVDRRAGRRRVDGGGRPAGADRDRLLDGLRLGLR